MLESLSDQMQAGQVGWKFARLKELHDQGIRVPRLFCLTADSFRQAMEPVAAKLEEIVEAADLDDWQSIQAASQKIREEILAVGLGEELRHLVAAQLAAEFPNDAMLAVRASVVAASTDESEDSADNPFAGMSDSFLYVPMSGVDDAILKCWASAFSPEGLLYRHRQGLSLEGLSVAVGVQRMVFGERSLVLFTCDPITHADTAVISACWGIGEGVVQEKAPVDHYFVDPMGTVIESRIGKKTTMVSFDSERGCGTREAAVDPAHVDEPVLGAEEAAGLAELGRKIEAVFGEPQDIEAAITDDGLVHVVQSRPIALAREQHRLWSSANVSESFPNTTIPMTYSVARRFYWLLNHDYLRRCGLNERELYEMHGTMTRLLGFLDNRIYHNINSFIEMLSALPIFDAVRRDWERLVAELNTYYRHPHTPPAGARNRVRRAGKLVSGWVRVVRNYRTMPRDFKDFEQQWSQLLQERRDSPPESKHPLKLVTEYREVWRSAGRLWGITLINYQFMVLSHKIIERCMDSWGIDEGDRDTLFSQLLCGGRQLKGAEIALSAVHLAELVRSDHALTLRFRSEDPEEIWQALNDGDIDPDLTRAVRSHLDAYGDRGIEELKLEKRNLRETPWELLRLVRQYAATETNVAAMEETERATRLSGENLLATSLPDKRVKTALLLWLCSRLRDFLYYREVGRYMRSELFGYSKQVIRALGSDLVRRGVLESEEDVFLLDIDELLGFVDGTGNTRDLAGLAEVRRNDFSQSQLVTPRREFVTADVVTTSIPKETHRHGPSDSLTGDSPILQGLGSCQGIVRGYARVVSDPQLGGDMGEDSILVARETDPGWLYLMLASKAIVVERGSLLSHTAITGRKFGIPTIVAVPGATDLIPEGALLEVDGAAGTVTLLTEEEDA